MDKQEIKIAGQGNFKLFAVDDDVIDNGLDIGNIISIKNILVGRKVRGADTISVILITSDSPILESVFYIRRSYVDSEFKTIKMNCARARHLSELSFEDYDNLYLIFNSKTEAIKHLLTRE